MRGFWWFAVSQRYIDAMHEDEKALGNELPTAEPRATETIPQIQQLISTLIEQGHAYHVPGGDVYFEIATCSDYGKLSGRKPDELLAGERIAVDENKKNPLDFVLWKAAKTDEPHWESPWGPGRPGWHIRRWLQMHSVNDLIYTVVEWICNFHITKMKLPRVSVPTVIRSPITGCIMVWSGSMMKRCRSHLVISLLFGMF